MKEILIVLLNCLALIVAGRLLYIENDNLFLVMEMIAIACCVLFWNVEHHEK